MNLTSLTRNVREGWSERHDPERFAVFADAYWRALLLIAAIAVVGIASYGAVRFIAVLSPIETTQDAGRGPTIDRKQLQETLSGFDRRARNHTTLKTTPPQVADPSK